MSGRSAAELLQLPVRLHGIQLGRPVDLILGADGLRALGFAVRCGDEVHRFLPLAAADVGDDEISVGSALFLLDEAQSSFYRRNGLTLRALLGAVVEQGGRPRGALRDLVVGEGGAVTALVVDIGGRRANVAVDETVRVGSDAASAA